MFVRKIDIFCAGALRQALVWLLLLLALPLAANEVRNVRVWPSPDSTRVVLDLASAPDYNHFTLQGPERLVIDLSKTSNSAKLASIALGNGLVSSIGSAAAAKNSDLRLVLNLKGKVKPVLFPLKPQAPYGYRLVIDLYPATAATPEPMMVNRAVAGGERDVVIAVDAGHGGEDPGAIGPRKTQEKRVTLAIAKKVAALIDAEPGMKAVLTRTGDYYVNLNRRSELARKQGADLLLSIHADAVESRTPHGASTWVLSSRRAQSELGRWLEQHEKHSELLGGAGDVLSDNSSERYLTHTLLDMSMDHSREVGYAVSRRVLDELGRVAHLHKRHPESASLAVLKAPDIPSLLIETGFISNPTEERKLGDSAYQQKLARAIVSGVRRHFHEAPPEGTLLAARKAGGKPLAAVAPRTESAQRSNSGQPSEPAGNSELRHKVSRGESLTLLAKRHNTTVAALVAANSLRDQNIRIGQWLTIPGQPAAALSSAPASRQERAEPAPEPAVAHVSEQRHRVKSGESLGLLAKRNNTTVAALMAANNLRDQNIRIGQWLTIPGQPAAAVSSAPAAPQERAEPAVAKVSERRHQVKSGESLGLLAKRNNTTVAALMAANNLRDKNIRIGQWLTIPGSSAAAAVAEPKVASRTDRKHKVSRGESLTLLAKRYNTSVTALVEVNGLRDQNIRIGQVLTIPQS